MKRRTKSAAVLAAAAALAIGAALTSLAAPGWRQNEDGTWTYYEDTSLMSWSAGSAASGPGVNGSGEDGTQGEEEPTDGEPEEEEQSEEEPGDETPPATHETARDKQAYTTVWSFVGKLGDGALSQQGWYQTIPDDYQEDGTYEDTGEDWYYVTGGRLCRNEIKTIGGKNYAFDSEGRRLSGLRLIGVSPDNTSKITDIIDPGGYDTRDKFIDAYNSLLAASSAGGEAEARNIYSPYFFKEKDGHMSTGAQTVELDGDKYSFKFNKTGSLKGSGVNGIDNKKFYHGGMQILADKDDKYEAVILFKNGTIREYRLAELLEIVGCDTPRSGETYANQTDYYNSQDGPFKALLEREMGPVGPVDNYYIVDTAGTVQNNSDRKDGSKIHVVLHGTEIARIYREE